ncbi:MAG: RagB/SusD family nutrient uptake outer membrane protein [Prevotellaceae bacterium]|jgi:hypothetical protein|nr:RagB/SusD family nutrient uptake outer membrane protein [Prevotellaceae bacterium]
MKNIAKTAMLALVVSFCSCEDFFRVQTDNVLDGDDYIAVENEMYAGYIGITTKVQAIGDKAIYLTETRGELLEPTVNTGADLRSLYNYAVNLKGNSYADPAPYYDVIIACNDYIAKMREFKSRNAAGIDEARYKALISSTLRMKAWTYLTIAKIYGEVVWFDDPLIELKDISQFEEKDLDQTVAACKELLTTGVDGINGTYKFSWVEWVDPDAVGTDGTYRYWDYMTPEYEALYAELCLWSGDYQTAYHILLERLQREFKGRSSDSTPFIRNLMTGSGSRYKSYWASITPYAYETVSAIIYNYAKNQTNSLLRHFKYDAPAEYLLAPSEAGRSRWADPTFNPLGSTSNDPRANVTFTQNSAGQWYLAKFGSSISETYQDNVPIYIYRGSELHFMLAEALNQLGRYEEAACIINQGVGSAWPSGGVTWPDFTSDWTSAMDDGTTRKYPNVGIRGSLSITGNRTFYCTEGYQKTAPQAPTLTPLADEVAVKRANDEALLDEMMLEFAGEGKNYFAMLRAARRYNDYSIIADRVCSKYTDPEEIRSKILAGGYFLQWDMK